MPSQPSPSEPSSGKTVPLVVYGWDGQRSSIGEAVVTEDADGWRVNATVTNEQALALDLDKGPFSIAVKMPEQEIMEAAAILRPRYKKETNAEDQA